MEKQNIPKPETKEPPKKPKTMTAKEYFNSFGLFPPNVQDNRQDERNVIISPEEVDRLISENYCREKEPPKRGKKKFQYF